MREFADRLLDGEVEPACADGSGRGYGIAPVTPPTPPDVLFSAYGG